MYYITSDIICNDRRKTVNRKFNYSTNVQQFIQFEVDITKHIYILYNLAHLKRLSKSRPVGPVPGAQRINKKKVIK